MPKVLCKCREVIRLGEIPCQHEWLIISDTQFDQIEGPVDTQSVYKQMKSMLLCPGCSRLWVYWSGYSSEPTEYLPANRPPQ
jgi:hypothetical protein